VFLQSIYTNQGKIFQENVIFSGQCMRVGIHAYQNKVVTAGDNSEAFLKFDAGINNIN